MKPLTVRYFILSAICTGVLVTGGVSKTAADPKECRNAVDEYRSARSDIRSNLKLYALCVDGNEGHDDCSVEFSNLQSAQNDFESAISEYETECR